MSGTGTASGVDLFDAVAFDRALAQSAAPLPLFKGALKTAHAELQQRFQAGAPATPLVLGRARFIDELLKRAWRYHLNETSGVALVAVGGYGRGELHPHSDIDLMVLTPDDLPSPLQEAIRAFILFLWDLGLEVGHSVRTVDECVSESRADITVATNLMESRLLSGPEPLYAQMRAATGPHQLWSGRAFFEAKWQEQIARHHKYHDTAYNLEPNVKEGPGGLRDIQMIGWVAKRHFGAETLAGLVEHGFLTEQEYRDLMAGQEFLWRVRFGLHTLAGRREDRLLFDHQRALANLFDYSDVGPRLAVERFMEVYYRTIKSLSRLNEMLLQLFQEEILYGDEPSDAQPINRRFQARKGFVEVAHSRVFERYPFALLELFLILAEHPELKGVRAETIRLLYRNLHRIDDRFRADLRCRSLFMEILRQPRWLTRELRRMNRYGVLGAYLPAFGRIVGQMQHDLFHVYTVDEHTLALVRNLRRFSLERHAHEFPLCSQLMRDLPKPEVLYIAALYHDIAKGRGGDHSELGADEVTAFCQTHQLSRYDTRLAAWLVRNHLVMSTTAQRKDISDPDVVTEFARKVGNQNQLDYLYLLTVADIRATSPSVWNSWKDALLIELYTATRHALRRGLGNPIDEQQVVADTQEETALLLRNQAVDAGKVAAFWARLDHDYFLRYSVDEIAWHTLAVVERGDTPHPLVLIRQQTRRGGTEIFLYSHLTHGQFARVTTALDQMGLNIVDARIIASRDHYSLDTYIVLEQNGEPIADPARIEEIQSTLDHVLEHPETCPLTVKRHLPRRLRHFAISPEITFEKDPFNERTILEVVASDRPGLLSRIGQVLSRCEVQLQNAKITTLGERVEDVFFITNAAGLPLDAAQVESVRNQLLEALQ